MASPNDAPAPEDTRAATRVEPRSEPPRAASEATDRASHERAVQERGSADRQRSAERVPRSGSERPVRQFAPRPDARPAPPPTDAEPELPDLKSLDDFSLMDLEKMWLILSGTSVIDWQRLDFRSIDEARAFLRVNAFDLRRTDDLRRLEALKMAAIDYLRRQFRFPIPRPIEDAPVDELMLIASGKGHRQLAACVILKAAHIIHHVEARELLFALPMSDQDVFRLVEERVYRVVGHMLSAGKPITEFVSGRKRRDSIYTKLLSKSETHASAVYDKLRFRIVTKSRDDVLPVLLYLSEELFPFHYVVPHESINTLVPLRGTCGEHPAFRTLVKRFPRIDDLTLSSNTFSAASYRILHFVVDVPVRAPREALVAAPPGLRAQGPVIFALCEFQVVDRQTEEANDVGDASHASYKERQRRAVMQRLKLGS